MTFTNQSLTGVAIQQAAQSQCAPPPAPKIDALINRAKDIHAALRDAIYSVTAVADRVHGAIPVAESSTSKPSRSGSIGELEDAFDAIAYEVLDLRMQIARLQDL